MARRVAAIDCGTNSVRLLVADVDPARHELRDVLRRMEITRLGQGVDATGRLAPEALTRTLRVLAGYAEQIADAGAAAIRMVATSATRDASNAAEFTGGVQEILGVLPEVISGDEEARLSFAGATAELAGGDTGDIGDIGDPGDTGDANGGGTAGRPLPPYLVVDIGGGSTEFVLGSPPAGESAAVVAELAAISVDIGCVRLTERHLHADPPEPAEVAAAVADVDAALAKVAGALAVQDAQTLVGLAGSVTTVAAIALGLPAYDPAKTHHAVISAPRVHQVTEQLLGQTHAQRAAIGALHPGRVDVIGAGALVLDRVLQEFGFGEVVISEHDILDGIAWSIAGQ